MSFFRLLACRWNRFWFEPSRPTDLALSRLLVGGLLTLFYAPYDFRAWGAVDPSLYQPVWLFERLGISVLSASAIGVLQAVWKTSLLFTGIGLFTNASALVAAALGLYLLGLPHNFGQTYHFDAAIVFTLAILAFSRCGDAWSVDTLRRVARRPDAGPQRASGEYCWPVKLVWTVMAAVFAAAGIAKIWTSGAEWIVSDHLAILLDRVQYGISDADPLVSWGSAIAHAPLLPNLMAATTVVVETAYPLALFRTPLRPALVLAGIGLIVGIRALMGPTFEQFLFLNLFWVPWVAVAAWLRQRIPAATKMTVFYDGGCGLCRPAVAIMRRLDLLGRVGFLDITRDWDTIAASAPSLSPVRASQEMHAQGRDGRIFAGFDAYRAVAHHVPLGCLLLPLMYLPPIPRVGRLLYRRIADHRKTACTLPRPQQGEARA